MNKLFLLGVLTLGAVAACGGSVVADPTGASSGSGAGSTGTDAGSTGTGTSTTSTGAGGAQTTTGTGASTTGSGGGTRADPCPVTAPAAGASCAGVPDQVECTYGSSVRADCRDAWICEGGSWTSTSEGCTQPAPGECPTSEPVSGSVCGTTAVNCVYNDDVCFCGCPGGPACMVPFDWQCAAPPTTPGCPPIVPNEGTPCSAEGLECDYGLSCTATGANVTCTDGLWTWERLICG